MGAGVFGCEALGALKVRLATGLHTLVAAMVILVNPAWLCNHAVFGEIPFLWAQKAQRKGVTPLPSVTAEKPGGYRRQRR